MKDIKKTVSRIIQRWIYMSHLYIRIKFIKVHLFIKKYEIYIYLAKINSN